MCLSFVSALLAESVSLISLTIEPKLWANIVSSIMKKTKKKTRRKNTSKTHNNKKGTDGIMDSACLPACQPVCLPWHGVWCARRAQITQYFLTPTNEFIEQYEISWICQISSWCKRLLMQKICVNRKYLRNRFAAKLLFKLKRIYNLSLLFHQTNPYYDTVTCRFTRSTH